MTVISPKDYTGHICENHSSEQDVALQIEHYVSDIIAHMQIRILSCC
jgi:hypothetical protein